MQKCTTIIGVLTMLEDGYSYRDIQARFAIGNSTITDIKRKFLALDYSLSDLSHLEAHKIESLFYGHSKPRKAVPLPDFKMIYDTLSDKKNKTNLYFLWMDYKRDFPEGYQYTQFKFYFKKWLETNHLEKNLVMAVNRSPGEIMYIDWIGDTLPLVLDSDTGELKKAHFFITTVGVSSYCFAMAFPDEKTLSFTQGTIEALNFYGCVPKILKPDNTKAAVIKNTKDSLVLNQIYQDIQNFYHVVIVPAPPLKPRGKATVENHVRWLETHLLERLRGRFFTSFADLNLEITEIIETLNLMKYQNGNGNRKQTFETFDKPAMRPLPKEALSICQYAVKTVPNNYHIEYDNHYYSVPFSYFRQEVMIKASFHHITICDTMNRFICKHTREYKAFPKYITNKNHLPSTHQYYYVENSYNGDKYKEWAKNIGDPLYLLICTVIAGFHYEEQSYKSCHGILQICKGVPKVLANQAAKECLDHHICTYSHFKKILNRLVNDDRSDQPENPLPKHQNIRGKENYQ